MYNVLHRFPCAVVVHFWVGKIMLSILKVLKEASRLYGASWVRDIGPDLRPNDYKKYTSEDSSTGDETAEEKRDPSTLEDLGI